MNGRLSYKTYIYVNFVLVTWSVLWTSFYAGAINTHNEVASNVNITPVTDRTGFNPKNVDQVWQGPEGFIYFLSNNRILRYDGHRLRGVFEQPQQRVNKVQSDGANAWLGTDKGLGRFDMRTQTFDYFNGYRSNAQVSEIQTLAVGGENRLWLSSGATVYLFDRQSFHNTQFNWPELTQSGPIQMLMEDKFSRLWMVTESATLWRFDPKANAIESISVPLGVKPLKLYQTLDGDIWLAGKVGLWLLEQASMSWQEAQLPESNLQVTQLRQDSAGNLWLASEFKGILLKTADTTEFHWFSGIPMKANGLVFAKHRDIFIDKYDVVWLATNNGVYLLSTHAQVGQGSAAIIYSQLQFDEPSGSVTDQVLSRQQSVYLSSTTDHLTINFAVDNYSMIGQLEYTYRLHPQPMQWKKVPSNNPHANLTGLLAGNYRLEVKTRLGQGNWQVHDNVLLIQVAEPWWFENIRLVIAAFTLFILVVFRISFNKHKRLLPAVEGQKSVKEQSSLPIQEYNPQQPKITDSISKSNLDSLVLVVAKESSWYDMLRQALSNNHDVIFKDNLQRALSWAVKSVPDVILVQQQLIEEKGEDFCSAIKHDPMTCHIPLILLNEGQSMQSDVICFDASLNLPITDVQVSQSIEKVLKARKVEISRSVSFKSYPQPPPLMPTLLPTEPSEEIEVAQQQPLPNCNEEFLIRLEGILDQQLSNTRLDVPQLANLLYTSKRQLNRKVKAATGLTPWEAIKDHRLKVAAKMLLNGQSPGNVAFDVGFTSHAYFSTCFKAKYQCEPRAYRQRCNKE